MSGFSAGIQTEDFTNVSHITAVPIRFALSSSSVHNSVRMGLADMYRMCQALTVNIYICMYMKLTCMKFGEMILCKIHVFSL